MGKRKRGRSPEGPRNPRWVWGQVPSVLVQRGERRRLLPCRSSEQGSGGSRPPRGARSGRGRDSGGRGRLIARRKKLCRDPSGAVVGSGTSRPGPAPLAPSHPESESKRSRKLSRYEKAGAIRPRLSPIVVSLLFAKVLCSYAALLAAPRLEEPHVVSRTPVLACRGLVTL